MDAAKIQRFLSSGDACVANASQRIDANRLSYLGFLLSQESTQMRDNGEITPGVFHGDWTPPGATGE